MLRKGTNEPVTIGPVEKMSKSKKNVVPPEVIAESYGVDCARWFMLSDTPPERDSEWTQSGVDGSWRFVQRLYRLVFESTGDLPSRGSESPVDFGIESKALRQTVHRTIHDVSNDLESFRFNRAVARIYELVNALADFKAKGAGAAWAKREALETLICLVAPMTPHVAEECWKILGGADLLVRAPWPKADPDLVRQDTVTLAVQVNGKRRAEIDMPRDAAEDAVRAAALDIDAVKRAMEGKAVKKFILVPNRIANIVVG